MENTKNKEFYWPILGHENISKYLQNLLLSKNFCHTYLFSGVKGLGKKTITNYFIQSIFCQKDKYLERTNEKFPCQECVDCRELLASSHPDCLYIGLEENKKNISINQVREFKEKFYLSPMRSNYKVAVIKDADYLSIEASNALLKIIEEPPKNSIVILISENIENLLATIKSRSQIINFNSVSQKKIYDYLLDLGADEKISQELSDFSGGMPGIAINFYRNLDSWNLYKEDLRQMLEILDNPINDRLNWVEKKVKLSKNSSKQYLYFSDILGCYKRLARDLLMCRLNEDIKVIHSFLDDVLKKVSSKYSVETLLKLYNKSVESEKMLSRNVNPRLVFENLLLL